MPRGIYQRKPRDPKAKATKKTRPYTLSMTVECDTDFAAIQLAAVLASETVNDITVLKPNSTALNVTPTGEVLAA